MDSTGVSASVAQSCPPPHASKPMRGAAVAFVVVGALATALAISIVVAIVGIAGHSPWDLFVDSRVQAAAALRAPHTIQAFGNLLLLDTTCALAAILHSRRFSTVSLPCARRFAAVTAIFSGIAAVLMHASVWGMPIVVPSQYTLLTPDHLSVVVLPLGFSTPGDGPFQAGALSIVIHLFSPQVLVSITACVLAIRRAAR